MLVFDTALGELTGDELLAVVATEDEDHSETTTTEEHAEEAEETVNPVLPTGSDIIYAAIFFFALWAALRYVLMPPVQKVRAERAARIAAARDAADNASADMGSAQADYDAALADARTEAAAILDTARAEADAHRAEVIGAAEADVATLRSTAVDELTGARGGAWGELTDTVAEVAAGAASTVLGRQIDVGVARTVVNRLQGDQP